MNRTILEVSPATYNEILNKILQETKLFLGELHDAPEGAIDMYSIALVCSTGVEQEG